MKYDILRIAVDANGTSTYAFTINGVELHRGDQATVYAKAAGLLMVRCEMHEEKLKELGVECS